MEFEMKDAHMTETNQLPLHWPLAAGQPLPGARPKPVPKRAKSCQKMHPFEGAIRWTATGPCSTHCLPPGRTDVPSAPPAAHWSLDLLVSFPASNDPLSEDRKTDRFRTDFGPVFLSHSLDFPVVQKGVGANNRQWGRDRVDFEGQLKAVWSDRGAASDYVSEQRAPGELQSAELPLRGRWHRV